MVKKMRIAVVDIDGILWSMAPEWYEELRKINPNCPFPGSTTSWNFHKGYMSDEVFQETIDAIHMRQAEFNCFPKAKRLTNMLHNAGFYVKIASHRTSKSKGATLKWLCNHDIYYDELHTVNDKHFLLKDAQVFIDDSPASQEYAISIGLPVLSIRYPYNKHIKGALLFDSFNEMLNGLEDWLENNVYNYEKYVTISKLEYDYLLACNKHLIALEGSGVKNWKDYAEATKNITTKML